MTIESTINYYNPFIIKGGKITNIPFNLFLSYISIKPSDERFKKLDNSGEYSLIKMKLSTETRYNSDRAMSFADYRARKPKEGAKGTDKFEDIKSDVFEATNCFYQHTENLFIMEYNHYGAKINNIKEYLKEFLPKKVTEEDVEWDIEFKEVLPKQSLKDVLLAKDIKSLEIKLDLTSTQVNYFKQSINQKYKKSITEEIKEVNELNNEKVEPEEEKVYSQMDETMKNIIKTRSLFGGGSYVLYIGGGRKWKNNPLEISSIKEFLKMIDVDSSLYMSINVTYIPQNETKAKNLDLKNSKVLHSRIQLDGDAFETVTSSIEEYFYDKSNRKGAGKNKDHKIEDLIAEENWPFGFEKTLQKQ